MSHKPEYIELSVNACIKMQKPEVKNDHTNLTNQTILHIKPIETKNTTKE